MHVGRNLQTGEDEEILKGKPWLQLTKDLADEYTFKLKTPWSDGTTHLLLSGMELLEKISALIPPPRVNLVRYHGVLAPHGPVTLCYLSSSARNC